MDFVKILCVSIIAFPVMSATQSKLTVCVGSFPVDESSAAAGGGAHSRGMTW